MADQEKPISSVEALTLDLPPSCIEFCPAHPTYFVVGTYNLQKEEVREDPPEEERDNATGHSGAGKNQSRNGTLIVFRLDAPHLINEQTVQYPSAILDLHFHPVNSDVLAVVSSTGTLSFFRLSASGHLEEIVTHTPLGQVDGVLFLSCAWHPVLHDLLAVTTSDFHVHIFRIDSSWNVQATSERPAASHQLEAWTTAFSPMLPKYNDERNSRDLTIFSGGDDSKLLASTLSYSPRDTEHDACDSITSLYPPIGFKGHEAGVTAILPLTLQLDDSSSIVVTGSYDDHIRVFQFWGPLQRPAMLCEANLGGGVWRLKTIEGVKDQGDEWHVLLLASCMHAGARIVRISGDKKGDCQLRVLGRFEEHKSMNYGSDYAPESVQRGGPLQCVSTSFYDRLVCLWEFDR